MRSNKALKLLYAKRWGFLKHKFLRFSKPQIGCESGLNQNRPNVAKAIGPILLLVTALVVFWLVSIFRNEILNSLNFGSAGLDWLPASMGCWSLSLIFRTSVQFSYYFSEHTNQSSNPPCSLLESLAQVLLSLMIRWWKSQPSGQAQFGLYLKQEEREEKVYVWDLCAYHLCINR